MPTAKKTAKRGAVAPTKKVAANGTARPSAAPFGSQNRQRHIGQFLSVSQEPPWMGIYRLLLWTDKTTGLAHCYESDKCQPGKPWHARSLRFHAWLSNAMSVQPVDVAEGIDWLFRRTADDYARYMVQQYKVLLRRAVVQRAPFAALTLPEPGDDPAIVDIIRGVLGNRLSEEPAPEEWRAISQKIRELIAVENKRKNLVGEGFEDVVAAVARKFDAASALDVWTRCTLSSVPGFANTRIDAKPIKVDLAIVQKATGRRTIVTAKWSIRADREQQFAAEFANYVMARSDMKPFDYVLLTNEFDPARLKRACESQGSNSAMFAHVVHISPDALRAVYGAQPEQSMQQVLRYIDDGRLLGVDDWLESLTH